VATPEEMANAIVELQTVMASVGWAIPRLEMPAADADAVRKYLFRGVAIGFPDPLKPGAHAFKLADIDVFVKE
jgi:hypothetical protein